MKMSEIGLVAGMRRPMAELTVTEQDRETLTRWSRRATSAQALALRSRIAVCGREVQIQALDRSARYCR